MTDNTHILDENASRSPSRHDVLSIEDADNVVALNVVTTLPVPCKRVIAAATKQKFSRVVIIGVLESGEEYFASSEADGGSVLWDMERAKHKLMQVTV